MKNLKIKAVSLLCGLTFLLSSGCLADKTKEARKEYFTSHITLDNTKDINSLNKLYKGTETLGRECVYDTANGKIVVTYLHNRIGATMHLNTEKEQGMLIYFYDNDKIEPGESIAYINSKDKLKDFAMDVYRKGTVKAYAEGKDYDYNNYLNKYFFEGREIPKQQEQSIEEKMKLLVEKRFTKYKEMIRADDLVDIHQHIKTKKVQRR